MTSMSSADSGRILISMLRMLITPGFWSIRSSTAHVHGYRKLSSHLARKPSRCVPAASEDAPRAGAPKEIQGSRLNPVTYNPGHHQQGAVFACAPLISPASSAT
jgi:hypothetical protein